MNAKLTLAVAIVLGVAAFSAPSQAQRDPKDPKNTVSQIKKARKKNHYQRQVMPSPKKSPGKHADNLSKNVNHEMNRESKDFNHFFQGKKKKK